MLRSQFLERRIFQGPNLHGLNPSLFYVAQNPKLAGPRPTSLSIQSTSRFLVVLLFKKK
jgi:hypothetical protein